MYDDSEFLIVNVCILELVVLYWYILFECRSWIYYEEIVVLFCFYFYLYYSF